MSAVNPKSTEISVNEGNRVADTLISMLKTAGIDASKRMQGSVKLNIHIEGHSDVDMLIIRKDIVLIDTPRIDGTLPCKPADQRPMVDIIAELRTESESKLTSRYQKAKVDCSNNKSISLEGGSLKRKIDIVPSCWYYTHDYQKSGLDIDAGVHIFHKSDHTLIGNFPFKHIHRVTLKDEQYLGNLKKVIRLLKNLVADMPDYKKMKTKKLTSYDLAGIAYHMDKKLNVPPYMALSLVENTRSHLFSLKESKYYRDSLKVPDDTRKIFDNNNKDDALDILTQEIDDLAKSIYKELCPESQTYDSYAITGKVI